MRFPDNIVAELMELQWWNYSYVDFQNIPGDIPVEQFIDYIKQAVADGKLKKYDPVPLTGAEILATAE